MKNIHTLMLLMVCLSYTTVKAQRGSAATQLLLFHGDNVQNAYFGYVILNNGDSLKGIIKPKQIKRNKHGIKFQVHSFEKSTFVPLSNIQKILLAQLKDSTCPINSTAYTLLFTFSDSVKLWRLVFRNKISVYDDLCKPISATDEVGERIKFASNENKNVAKDISLEWSLSEKSKLIKFANERYGTSFKNKDFSNRKSILKYIADRG